MPMLRCFFVCCFLLAVVDISAGIVIPKFDFCISSRQNETGQWIAEVRFHHEKTQPWDVFVNHTTIKHNGSEAVAIVATILPPITDETSVPSAPPAGYERLSDYGYYKIYTNHITWFDAMKSCADDGAHLLVLKSKKEALEMKNLMKKVGSERYWHWVGVHDHYKEGKYLTIFSEPLADTGYSDWYQGQPDGGDLQNCVYLMFSRTTDYGLGDVDCNGKGPYICKKEIT